MGVVPEIGLVVEEVHERSVSACRIGKVPHRVHPLLDRCRIGRFARLLRRRRIERFAVGVHSISGVGDVRVGVFLRAVGGHRERVGSAILRDPIEHRDRDGALRVVIPVVPEVPLVCRHVALENRHVPPVVVDRCVPEVSRTPVVPRRRVAAPASPGRSHRPLVGCGLVVDRSEGGAVDVRADGLRLCAAIHGCTGAERSSTTRPLLGSPSVRSTWSMPTVVPSSSWSEVVKTRRLN